jgi:hypothetical protein
MISIYEDRIGAAKSEMAALQQAARLFDPEGGGEDTVLHWEFEGVREQEKRPPAQHEVWESETVSALLSTLPVCRCQQDIRFCRVFKPISLYVSIAVSHNLSLICGLIRGPDMGRLTARKVETAKPGKYGDGAGLQLSVAPTGAKKWVLRFL